MRRILALLSLSVFLFALPLSAAERGVKRVEIKTSSGETVGLYEESHALVIGVSEYTNGWPKLPGVRKDVKAVTAALEKKGFNVTQVNNPKDRRAIEDAFTGFIDRYGLKPENRLLFYFSGHGHTEKTTYGDEMGYIVPAASPNPKRDKQGFLKNAMDMQIIEVYAKRIQSKHALFVFDSCFSGALFALSRSVPESISYKTGKPVRQFITSGSADETVPDTSIFRQQFVSALEGEADLNKDHYVTGAELGEFLQESVINYSKGAQHPQYGKIRHPKLDKGDFVFQLASLSLPKAPSESNFSINDLQEEVKKQQERKSREAELKRKWGDKLKEMQAAFAKVKSLDSQQATLGVKVKAWRRFAKAFSENNPYSSKDETLRDHSQARIAHWQAEEKKQKQQATLTVRSNVYDDEVYINGKLKGSTKLTVTLEPGTYRVELRKTGYKSVYANITLKPGEQKTVKAELKRKTSQAALKQKQESEMPLLLQRIEVSTSNSVEKVSFMFSKTFREDPLLNFDSGSMSVRFTKTGLDPSMPTLISPEANPLIRTIRTTPSYSEGYVRVDLNFRQNRSLRGNPEITYSLDRITLTLFHRPVEDVWTESNTGMKFRRIPGGDFRMGSPSSEKDREDNEKQHTVSVGEFWLAETEVTQAQWQAVMGSNPSKFRGSDLPVEQVSWNDIQEFIRKLNRRTGKRFRLPTEAEWEYAARAGTQTAYYWGDQIGSNNANCRECGTRGRWDGKQTAPVGSFKPNAFGLFDMLGNVYEWTCSAYTWSYDGREQKCSVSASTYSLRGGSWFNEPWGVRAAHRTVYLPDGRLLVIGFRLVREN